ncbi:MAG TPA: glucoamylase family protein, partial [Bacteroidia bacterium]|nr:glucoamylase family protein [Bacteroidia bacterium]
MKLIPAAHELISSMRSFFQPTTHTRGYMNEEPLRAELFSYEQMGRFGKTLAETHKLSTKSRKDHLLKRLADNEIILHEVRKLLTDTIKRKYQITPAGEWLIDNFYLVEEHIRNAKVHFPKKYSEDLPQILNSTSTGLTRIYDIGLQIISHSDGRIDIETLSSFVKAYQSVETLKLGELWAIPIMLRLGLIENLRRVSSRIAIDRIDSNLADYWAKQMIETVERDPKSLVLVIADMARSNPPMVSAFVSELTRQLRGKGPDLALALNWIEQQLSESGTTSAELVNLEIQKQAADQVSMSNSIGSLRLLGSTDWRNFVEDHSLVEQILRKDYKGIYGLMDFSTRDRYRHVVEGIAKKSKLEEYEVASIALELAQENKQAEFNDERTQHVGYYLIDKGVMDTRRRGNLKEPGSLKMRKAIKKNAFLLYFLSIAFITVAVSGFLLYHVSNHTDRQWILISIGILLVLCASQLAISVVNFFSTLIVKPDLLPRMDFSKNISDEYKTLVVVPVMLNNPEGIEKLVESIEVHYLANRKANLYFGLLTDFVDAIQEEMPEDKSLVDLAQLRIEELNRKYNRNENDLFYLFHRPRHWNPREKVWMGYERKRGKLSELNSLLRGDAKDRFSLIIGDQSVFPGIKYVITLDADTLLPLGSAWKLIGTMAHPLNHAWYNEKKKRVTKGYGILQPRVTVSLPDIQSTTYARMHGNEPGIDPYTRASSDVYQDLFGEGSFIGKGIYDVDVFKSVLDGKFAENGILSHDLLEGCYVRSGLLNDVQLFENYPSNYDTDMKRRGRWVRGDWQIIYWLLPFVPGYKGHWNHNPISALSRWKIFDNIRRSLVPAALTTLIVLGWLALPTHFTWTLTVSAIIVVPIFITTLWDIIRKPKDVIWTHHIKNSVNSIGDIFIKTSFTLICLPYEAFFNLLAIVRTCWRLFISRRKLLEWNPYANEEAGNKNSLSHYYSSMWIEPLLAISICVYLLIYSPIKLDIVGPIILLWAIAPLIVWRTGKPVAKQVSSLTDSQNIFLYKLARKTWSFFEKFVDQEENWLPPDNFQEQPVALIAHRTSPTNIGFALVANISAYDFGYISFSQFIDRTMKTIETMEKMERYKGHFYNWYDTENLSPLLPKYISTVDSGNLVGYLLVLKQELVGTLHKRVLPKNLFNGILDTFRVLEDTIEDKKIQTVQTFKKGLEATCELKLSFPQEVRLCLKQLTEDFAPVFKILPDNIESNTYWWKHALNKQLLQAIKEMEIFEPWCLLLSAPEKFKSIPLINIDSPLIELLQTARELQASTEGNENSEVENEWLKLFHNALDNAIRIANERIALVESLAVKCNELADVEWDFLYDKSSNLLTIGYNVQTHHADASSYDLLASEARLCSFIGIAQGKLPEENWFALSRLLTNLKGDPILLSWSGSMFEYLMPLLVMPSYENTLLGQTYKAAVDWQVDYGKHAGKPWGISESGYNMINANSIYQYRAFGAPGLGLKRGLEEDSVIAPYATALALMVDPVKACENMEVMSKEGFEGRYGFYEAVDYTPSRLQRGQTNAIVYSFMAHHQGMSLLSLAYLLLDKPMQKLFESEPQFKAALLLLQERIPRSSSFFAHTTDIADINYVASGTETRIVRTPNTPIPEVQLLSNGRYHVMITNAGGGYSNWKDIAVTRWREDSTRDNWGTFCYICDLESGKYWSNTNQPALKKAERYEAAFSQGRVDFRVTNNEIESHTEIVVSPEDDIEMRRLSITNHSAIHRTIEVTSYAEVVLAPSNSDLTQAAFNNLFVETEILEAQHSILCTRRPRSSGERIPHMFHLMTLQGKESEHVSYETSRIEFIGRGNSTINPKALSN